MAEGRIATTAVNGTPCGITPQTWGGVAHPLGEAIRVGATERGLQVGASEGFASHTGLGVTVTVDGRALALGSPRFLDERGVAPSSLERTASTLRAAGCTAVLLGVDGRPAGILAVADPVKDSA